MADKFAIRCDMEDVVNIRIPIGFDASTFGGVASGVIDAGNVAVVSNSLVIVGPNAIPLDSSSKTTAEGIGALLVQKYEIPAAQKKAEAWASGDLIYYDNTPGQLKFTNVSTNLKPCGTCLRASASGSSAFVTFDGRGSGAVADVNPAS